MFILTTSWLLLGVESNFASRVAVVPRHDYRRFMNPTSSSTAAQGGRPTRRTSLPENDKNTVTLASRIKQIKSHIDMSPRGGSSAVQAVKTMTARQMETFR